MIPDGDRQARIPAVIGLLGLLASLGVMTAWLAGMPAVIYPRIGTAMVFNTALCFALTAVGLILNDPASPRRIAAQQLLGGCIVLIAGMVESQYLSGHSVGIDWPALHSVLADGNPYPGRMSQATAITFVLCGFTLILMHRARGLWQGLLIQLLTVAVVFTGITALIGHLLALHLVFATYIFDQIAIYTAAGFIVAGVSLGLCWRETEWYASRSLIRTEVMRVSLIGLAILGTVAFTSFVAGFKITQSQAVDMIGHRLQETLKANVDALKSRIEQGTALAQAVASRPVSIEKMSALNLQPDNPAAIAFMKRVAESFLPLGASAIAYYSPEGKEWIRVGRFAEQPELTAPLKARYPASLMWDRGVVFRIQVPMISSGESVGTVVVEQLFDTLIKTHADATELGETGEIALCTLRDGHLHCFPQRLTPRVFTVPYAKHPPMRFCSTGNLHHWYVSSTVRGRPSAPMAWRRCARARRVTASFSNPTLTRCGCSMPKHSNFSRSTMLRWPITATAGRSFSG